MLLVALERVEVGLLAHGVDDAAGREHERGHVGGHRLAPAAGVGLAQLHLLADQTLDAVLTLALHRSGQVQELDAFFLRLFDLPGVGRHLVPRPAVDHLHLFRAQTDGGTGRVHGGVAAAQHQHGVADVHLLAQGHLAQELDGVHGAGQILARDAQRPPHVRADADERGLEAFLLQIGELDVAAQAGVVADLHALLLDELGLAMDDVAGQAVLGDAHVHHAARHGQVLEDGGRVAHAGQVVAGGEAGRTGADDGHLLLGAPSERRRCRRPRRPDGQWPGWAVTSSVISCGPPSMRAAASARAPPAPWPRERRPWWGRPGSRTRSASSARSSARSAHQRLMLLMAMGCPMGARLQLLSQGCGQVRPMMAGSGLSRLTMRVARCGCSSRPWKMYQGMSTRGRAGGAARGRHPAVLGGRLAGLALGVSGEVLLGQVEQRPRWAARWCCRCRTRRSRRWTRPACGCAPPGLPRRRVSASPLTSLSICSMRMSTPMRHGPQRPQDSFCSSRR